MAPGPAPVKSDGRAARRWPPLLEAPVANRRNLMIARLIYEIEAREGVLGSAGTAAIIQDAAKNNFRWRRPMYSLWRMPDRWRR